MKLLYVCDLFGIARTGTLAADRKCLDLFGVLGVVMMTALGGGTYNASASCPSTTSLLAMDLVFLGRMSALRRHWALPRFHLLDAHH